jgi:pyruvate formate lyase activating enzyme
MKSMLDNLTIEGKLYKKIDDNYIECYACAHRCKIKIGNPGICKVRYNENNKLRVPYGYIGAFQCDPIEKKPFFHVYPGSLALSFGMLGCDFKCSFCQNWDISQTLRDEHAGRPPQEISPNEIVERAKKLGARVIVSTYNEPLITSEWSVEVFKEAQKANIATGFVSNGHGTPEALDFIIPNINMYKIDLKSFNERTYRKMGGKLEEVLNSIKYLHKKGIWIEIVTLLIPNYNDSEEEVTQMAEFLADIDLNIPWHITAFHPDYKMRDREATAADSLIKAVDIGKDFGLKFVYAGNRPGMVNSLEDTKCPKCLFSVIKRKSFRILSYEIKDGRCPKCENTIPGIWEDFNKKDNRRVMIIS